MPDCVLNSGHDISREPAKHDSSECGLSPSHAKGRKSECFASHDYDILGRQGYPVSQPPMATTPKAVPKTLAFLPLHHTYGFHTFCIRGVLMPMTTVIMPKWNIDWALSLIPKCDSLLVCSFRLTNPQVSDYLPPTYPVYCASICTLSQNSQGRP